VVADGRRHRVLWLSNETPDVSGQGGQRRQYFQIRELTRAGVAVDAITLSGPQDDASLRAIADVRRVHRHRRFGIPDPVGRSIIARAVRDTAYDGIVVAHLDSWAMVERVLSSAGARVLVDLHNVLSAWADREGHHTRAVAFRRIERAVLGRVDAVAVCSEAEELRLGPGGTARRIVLPHGIDVAEWPEPGTQIGPPAVGAIGNWDWEPNRHGIEWFVRTVWPIVVGRVPDAEFIVAGAGLQAALTDAPGVRYLGRIEHGTWAGSSTVKISSRVSTRSPFRCSTASAPRSSTARRSPAGARCSPPPTGRVPIRAHRRSSRRIPAHGRRPSWPGSRIEPLRRPSGPSRGDTRWLS
jgi:polysaccharide biosynthesis protein PslH